jgi:hypothetical protein
MENVGNKSVLVFITLSTKEEMQFNLTNEKVAKLMESFISIDCKTLSFQDFNIAINKSHIVKIFITE